MPDTPSLTTRLRLPVGELAAVASRYADRRKDAVLEAFVPAVAARGYLSREEFIEVVRWKSARVVKRAQANSAEYVEAVTRFALSTTCERARIESLIALDGVQWPMASVILHFFHTDTYPILDFRALWSLGQDVPKAYCFHFWWRYVEECRSLVQRSGLSAREVDRGLWQYSKENQRQLTTSSRE